MKKIGLVFFALLFSFCIASCDSKGKKLEKYLENNPVVSLKDVVTVTDQKAEVWKGKPFLVMAKAYFGWADPYSFQVLYASSENPRSALWFHSENGVLAQKETISWVDLSQGISVNDWNIDSPDALQIALHQPDVIKFADDHLWSICGNINLERYKDFPNNPVLWRVDIENCSDPVDSIGLYIDPISGERIKD